MKKVTSLLFIILFSVLVISCKDNKKKELKEVDIVQKDSIIDTSVDTSVDNTIDTETKEYEPTDDELREYGIIVDVEDGAYPFYSVTVDFVERNMKQSFTVNIEGFNINSETLEGLKGKYATIYYTSDLENDLSDLHFEGKSLFGEYAPEKDDNWKQVTGILSGATSLSGDLPGEITITDTNGEETTFELYIEDETMKVNGKKVTAYYSLRSSNIITHIVPSSEE
tara:strand:- start:1885 stop:2559 length:675 start_codon:yes stop_codon:yes gene_type:complete